LFDEINKKKQEDTKKKHSKPLPIFAILQTVKNRHHKPNSLKPDLVESLPAGLDIFVNTSLMK
jgi:hypothetical protein